MLGAVHGLIFLTGSFFFYRHSRFDFLFLYPVSQNLFFIALLKFCFEKAIPSYVIQFWTVMVLKNELFFVIFAENKSLNQTSF